MNAIPPAPGSYALHMLLPQSTHLCVGALGEFFFPAGEYVYLGSAQGPGGLRARLGRHLGGDRKHHWHIDVLLAVAEVRGFWYLEGETALECRWSQALAALPQAQIPVLGFGASDCRSGCQAHLVAFPEPAIDDWLAATSRRRARYQMIRLR